MDPYHASYPARTAGESMWLRREGINVIGLAIAGLQHPHIDTIIAETELRPDVSLVAIAEPEEAVREKYRSRLNIADYADHRHMLDDVGDGVDVIGVGAINSDRGGIVVDALRAGVHVIADKPLCTTEADLDSVRTAWESSGRTLSIALEKRFYPPTLALREVLAEGELGTLATITASAPHKLRRASRPDWMFERPRYGGIINDLAVHDIDLMLQFSGVSSGEVHGYTGNRGNSDRPDFQDYGVAVVATHGGPVATFEAHWMSPEAADYHGDYRMRLVGTNGTAELAWKDDLCTLATHSRPPRTLPLPNGLRPAEDFFDAVLAGRPPKVSAPQALAATRLALTAQRAAETAATLSFDLRADLCDVQR